MNNMDIKVKFGKNLKNIRQNKKITQEKLAELAGIDRSYLSEVERGIKNISLTKIEAIANALDIKIYELLNF